MGSYSMTEYEVDLAAPAIGSPFRSSIVWNSEPLLRPFARPVALYKSEDHSLLGYQIGVFDRAVPPEVSWRGLQNVITQTIPIEGNEIMVAVPVLVSSLEDWEEAVKEHLGEYMADG